MTLNFVNKNRFPTHIYSTIGIVCQPAPVLSDLCFFASQSEKNILNHEYNLSFVKGYVTPRWHFNLLGG